MYICLHTVITESILSSNSQSNQLMDKYKQKKINIGVFTRIRQLLQEFEKGEILDRKLAWVGIFVLLVLLVVAIYLLSSGTSVTISS